MKSKFKQRQVEPPGKQGQVPPPAGRNFLGAPPIIALVILSGTLVISFGELIEIIPLFAPLTNSPLFPFFHEILDLLTLGVVLYAAYKYHTRLGVAAILLYLASHLVYVIIQSPKEAPESVRFLFSTLIGFLGIGLIDQILKSDELYRTLATSNQVGVYIVQDGRFSFVNHQFLEDVGYTEDELLGSDPLRLVHPEDREKVRQNATAMLKGERSAAYEFRCIDKAGNTLWIMERVASTHYRRRRATLGHFINITVHKQAEEAFQESEELYRSLFENMLNGFAYCKMFFEQGKPQDFTYLSVNSAFETLTGLKNVVGKRVSEVIPRIQQSDPELFEIYGRVASTGKPERFETYVQALNMWFSISVYSPQKEYFVAVFDVITERKQVQAKLERASKEWQTTFDSIVDPISIHDKDFKLVRVNEAFAEFLDEPPEELIGETCYKLIHGTTEPVSNCPYKKTIENKLPAEAEFFEPKLGRYLDVTTSPIFNDQGDVIACVHVTRDITERKKMDEQLMITDRLASIGQLASGIAHELNNPLTGVIGFSELLLERDVPDDIREDLTTINREAKRTAGIVKGLLTFARKQAVEKETVDINRIIQDVLHLRAYEQRVSNIVVKTQFATDLPEIRGNGAQLQQVFINLIVNAEQAMLEAHGSGNLTITTERTGDNVKAYLTDDGPGIRPENIRRLFAPFFTTKEVGKGTGLGLSICHGIVTEHSGRIYAESDPGKGATFIVELPIKK